MKRITKNVDDKIRLKTVSKLFMYFKFFGQHPQFEKPKIALG